MNSAALELFQKVRTAEQQRFATRCLQADAGIRARWAGKGFKSATLHELTAALLGVIRERADSLCTELCRIVVAASALPTVEQKAKLKSDYLTDLDSFQLHAESVLDQTKQRQHSSRMDARHTTQRDYLAIRQKYSNELDLSFLKRESAAELIVSSALRQSDPHNMSQRKSSDADVQHAVRSFAYPSQEATFRQVTQAWSTSDFLYAMDRVQFDVQGQHKFDFLQLVRKMRKEREVAEAYSAAEEAHARRHAELMTKMATPTQNAKRAITTLHVLLLAASTPEGYTATASKEEFSLFKELEANHYVVGQIGPDSHDAPETMIEAVRLTTNGRLLMEQLQRQAASPSSAGAIPVTAPPMNSKAVFIVHGHDDRNLLRLKEILRDRCKLEPIVLSAKPGKGRTIIEKFEAEAQNAAFASVILTPDDSIAKSGTVYSQARPNVIFELGWFYGRLGRARVCILFKKGTTIHSDLNGVSRIEFGDVVNEKIEEIEAELVSGGMLPAP